MVLLVSSFFLCFSVSGVQLRAVGRHKSDLL